MCLIEKTYQVRVGQKQTSTQVLSILPKGGILEKLLIFIPGNPGIIHFYRPFLYDILSRSCGRVGVLGLSQAGHCGSCSVEEVSLEAQIDHKVNFFNLVLSHPTSLGLPPNSVKQLVVLSHSLGSYLSFKSLARVPDLKVFKLIGLFPTIQHLRIGIPLAIRLSARPILRQGLAGLVHALPKKVRESILKWYCGQSEEVKYLLEDNIHQFRLINNVLSLAWDEIKFIRKIDDECHQFLNYHSDKISLIFSHKDPYVPLHFCQQMQETYPDIDIDLASEEVPHDFVFDHNKIVAAQVAEKLEFLKLGEKIP
ncbi:MAG: hypothetical protein AB8G05_17355 [Oligoflexales bacterium]